MEAQRRRHLLLRWLNFMVLISLSLTLARSVDDSCVYTIYVRTGTIIRGGTDSTISISLYDQFGGVNEISDLVSWGGSMSSGHDYFERGNLDIFTARGRCFESPVCAIRLASDGSGSHHGWFCNYVEVTSTGPHIQCAQQQFTVEQWLALDTAPYELTAFRDYCPSDDSKTTLNTGATAAVSSS